MTTREQQILALIRDDPMLSQQELAARLDVSRSAVAGHVMHLTRKGFIKGRGYVLSDSPFVTVIGGANIDIHGRSSQALVDRDSNPGEVRIVAGGVARNVAENLARLGADCRLIAAVGTDQHGQMLLQQSRDAGINVKHVHTIPAAKTSTYVSLLDDQGDMLFAINDMSIVDAISPELLQPQAAMLKQSALIVVDCNLHEDALAWLLQTCVDVPVFADTVSAAKADRLRPHLGNIHTLKTSAIEAEALLGRDVQTQKELESATAELHRAGTERVFITLGDRGVYFSDGETRGLRKTRQHGNEVRNAGGAGDAFLAGLAYCWLEQSNLEVSLEFALASAQLTLEHPGTNNPALSLGRIRQTMEHAYA